MAITVSDVYSVRFGAKLALPRIVQEYIAKLRVTPAPYKPVRVFKKHNHHRHHNNTNTQDWERIRESALEDYVRKIKQQDDKEYAEIFRILNKIAPSNVEQLSAEAIDLIQKRDNDFRLRISILLFDKAITQPGFSGVMAECARFLNMAISEIAEDLQLQITMFPRLYNMNETITIPESTDPTYDEKVIAWTKQKDKRRGYAKFMMELFAKELIKEDVVKVSLDSVVADLDKTAKEPKTPLTEENVSQFVTFVFESSKIVKGELKQSLAESVQKILSTPKAELPSLNMRSKFKLEDALKELNKKE